jgi:catechol 2,3-dioxygenase-like lactoylglutathione lyase family enzyme
MRIDHITIATDDLDATLGFYQDVLGLEVGPRPAFPFAEAWLYAGGRPIVHLKAPGVQRADSALDHVAFYTDDFSSFIARLDRMHLTYKQQVLSDGSLRQCFLRDPNGVRLEITGR